jgi:O-antigen/teichoic acid export membrane protein
MSEVTGDGQVEPTEADVEADDGLRANVVRGGRLLFIRQTIGLVISLGGVLALTRLIGPTDYGTYASAFGIAFFVQATGELSLDVYLVRHPGDLEKERCDQVFTLLVILAVVTTALTVAVAPLISQFLRFPSFEDVLIVMFLSCPAVHLQQVHLSRMEREFGYGTIGRIELIAQAGFFAVALPLAAAGSGVWAPVAGWWLQQIILLVGFWAREPYRPRFVWNPPWIREILSFGAVTNSSNLVYSLRTLVPAVVVGHALGAAAVGLVSLAVRLGQQLSFAQTVMFRISIAVLGRIADDGARMKRAMTQGAELQLLSVGIPLAGFSIVASVLVPLVFGHKWTQVATLIPLLAGPYMAMAMFSLLLASMSLQARPWDLIVAQASSSVLLWAAALILVPAEGLRGYGYAEMIATASWLITDRLMAGRRVRPDYRMLLLWWGGLSAAALAPVTTWWLLAAIPACLIVPSSARELRGIVASVLQRPPRQPQPADVTPL